MNSSLPLITPRDSHTLWYTPSSTYSFAPAPQLPYSNNHNNNNGSGSPLGPQNPSAQGQNQNTRSRTAGLSALQQLELDEQSVALRKLHIQRFGATWIRPPGMAKTYQGELDEKAEREEAEAHEMMEDVEIPGEGVFDVDEDGQALHANQDLDANIPDGGEISDLDNNIPEADSFVDGAEDEEDDGEVDLDADIPEAEAETLWDDSDEEEELEEDSDDGDHTGYASAHDVGNVSSTTADSGGSFGGTDESPQQAAFSHDERYPNNRRTHSGQEYGWRGRARYRRSDDNMEVDSE
ncbi:hypothetical protein BDD12DRAFT_802695 [Trichophaea hybrida]|nr:hypothetical protein BDD12DRAFT_802695 [Trichophaea hybrida]